MIVGELRIILPGSIRSKKNSKRIWAYGRFKKVLPSAAYMKWESEVRSKFFEYSVNLLTCPVAVSSQIYYYGQQPDLSGCLESIGDALEGIIWENDKQIYSWDGSRLFHDNKNPRTELIIKWE
jgi:Holliday junction resolvase RusA-like endonuclease